MRKSILVIMIFALVLSIYNITCFSEGATKITIDKVNATNTEQIQSYKQIKADSGEIVLFDFWFCSTFQENPADYLLEDNSWENIGLDLDIQKSTNLHIFDFDYLYDIEKKNPEPHPVSCNFSIYNISTERSTQALKSIYRHYLSLDEISYANGDMNIIISETA